jgi:hypothetical protein
MKKSGLLLDDLIPRGATSLFCIVQRLPVILQRLQIADLEVQLAIQNERNLTAAPFC